MGDQAQSYEELLEHIAISDMLDVLMQMNLSGLQYAAKIPSTNSLFATKPDEPNISTLMASVLRKNPDPSLLKEVLLAQLHAKQGHRRKKWHKSVTAEMRNHHVKSIIQAVYPEADAQTFLDIGTNNVVTYARKVEQMLFDISNTRPEYYKAMKEKVYNIQADLQERKKMKNTAMSAITTKEGLELVQKQLGVLLYANRSGTSKCSLPPSATMEGVMHHIKFCTAGDDCVVRHSSTLCDMISHWKSCNNRDCPTCSPLRV